MTIVALKGKQALIIAWLSLLAIAMNLFVLKQINLFGLHVTASDALAVGYLLGLNVMQEFFGKKSARQAIWISFFISASFVLLSKIHLAYLPNDFDFSQAHFSSLFAPMPRIIAASLFSFLIVQLIDLEFFGFLRNKTSGKYLALRTTLSLSLAQIMDTLLFSFLGLYGIVGNIVHILFLSLAVKGVVILLTIPFVSLSKKVIRYELQV